jgi:hypothetical protein
MRGGEQENNRIGNNRMGKWFFCIIRVFTRVFEQACLGVGDLGSN